MTLRVLYFLVSRSLSCRLVTGKCDSMTLDTSNSFATFGNGLGQSNKREKVYLCVSCAEVTGQNTTVN